MAEVDFVAVFSRWLHLIAAVMSIGGAIFMYLVLHPAAKESLSEEQLAGFRESVRRRWARLVHASIAVLLITGFFNFYWLAIRAEMPAMPYHALFGPKLLAALVIFFIASVLAGTSPGFAKWRKEPGKPLAMIVLLGTAIFLLTEMLSQIRMAAVTTG